MTDEPGRDDVRLFDGTAPEAGRLLREFRGILRRSFPPEEYVEYPDDEAEGYADGPMLIACGPDGAVLGGALGEVYPDSGTLLLGYLAVDPELRGSGVGTQLVQALRDRWFSPETFAIMEVEDPRHHQADPEHGDPAARLRFYARFGASALVMPYFQPRLRPDLPRAYHLLLCPLNVPAHLDVGGEVDARAVASFLTEYFVACEGQDALEDPEVEWLLDWCRPPSIGLVSLADLGRVPDDDPPGATARRP